MKTLVHIEEITPMTRRIWQRMAKRSIENMKTKTYQVMCPSCHGTGYVSNLGASTSTTRTCPACKGNQVVTVTETDDGMSAGSLDKPAKPEPLH